MNDAQVELQYGVATDVGLGRGANEASLLAQPPVFVVADGMGGHDGGEIASGIVVEEFARMADTGYDPRRGSPAVLETPRPGGGPTPFSRRCARVNDGCGSTPRRIAAAVVAVGTVVPRRSSRCWST